MSDHPHQVIELCGDQTWKVLCEGTEQECNVFVYNLKRNLRLAYRNQKAALAEWKKKVVDGIKTQYKNMSYDLVSKRPSLATDVIRLLTDDEAPISFLQNMAVLAGVTPNQAPKVYEQTSELVILPK